MNELVRRFNNSELSINLTSILILNNETNEFEPWFIAKEVATLLGYENTIRAVNRNVNPNDQKILSFDECKQLFDQNITAAETLENIDNFRGAINSTPNNSINSNSQGMKIINESGLYDLILESKKLEAKAFRRWVTSEVLPSIRKTGSYGLPQIDKKQLLQLTIINSKPKSVEQLAAIAELEQLHADEKKAIEAERDIAIKTKAYINDKRTASAMGKAGALTKENTKLTAANNTLKTELDTVNHQKALIESKLDVALSNMYSVDDVYHRVENLFHTGYQPSTLQSKLRKELNRISYTFGEVPKVGVNRRNPEHNPPKYYTKRVVEQIIENGKNDPMYFKHLKG